MKKRLLAMLLAFAIVLVSIPFGTMQVSAAEIPEGAPFTALTTDKGDVLGYEDMGTVTYTGYNTYENVPYYHVTIPSGATEVYVTHPSEEDPFADASYGAAYGYYASTEEWTGGGMTYSFEEAEDGYKITLPLSKTVTDWMTGETYELSFVADEDGYVSHAVAVERNDYSPIAFFTFEYAAKEEHTCSFGEWVQTTAPTCTEVGEETRSCECGKTETREVEATGHNYAAIVTAPTCTADGYTTYTCADCGESYTGDVIEATGHSYADGVCSVCGATDPNYKEETGVTIPDGAPFTAITTDAGEVTAIEDKGTVTYSGYSTYENVPYYHVTIPESAASVHVTHPSSEDPFADTSYGSAYGYYAETTGWTGGGMSYAFEEAEDGYKITLPLSKTGTDWSTGETYELSFVKDEEGNNPYAVAVERNDYSPIAFFTFEYAEGTTPEAPSDEPERKFTQITAGETVIAESEIEYKGIFKLGDSYSGDDDGYNYIHEVPYYMVTVPLGTENVDITYTADTKIMVDDPSATVTTARGYRTKIDESVDLTASATVYGTGFNNGYTKNSDGTQTVKTNVKDNTMKSDGYRWAITVEEPDTPFAAVTLFSFNYEAHDHSYNAVVTEPTCDKAGYTTHTCTLCFDSYKDNETSATGHNYKGVVTEPTCTEKGYTTYTCSVCGDNYKDNETEATGHTADGEGVVTDPTCIEKGYTTYTCEICKESYTADETEATGHSYEEEVIASTCTTKGYTLHTCSVCGDYYKDNETELTDHNYDENGCTVCGAPAEVDGVYQIGSEAALRWFETYVEAGTTTANAKLTADITVESSWDGIGTFAGSFDGNGKTVTFTNATNGLFARVKGTSSKRAEIKDVTVAGVINSTGNSVAGIVGRATYANITNCHNTAKVNGIKYVAGIIGYGEGVDWKTPSNTNILNCSNTGEITGTSENVAGILGYSQGSKIENSFNSGKISGSGNAGGIAGYIQGYNVTSYITNCYNTGVISGGTSAGLVGNLYNGVTVTNCYNTGENYYAIAGNIYNKKATVSNVYYLASASTEAAPANQIGYSGFSAVAKTSLEMSTTVAELLGEAFQASCPSPVFTTQTAAGHTGMEDGVCDECNYGSTETVTHTVTIPTGTGFEVTGETSATEGEEYTFTVTIDEDYMKGESFAVTVSNGEITDNGDGTYTVTKFISNFTITVNGVVLAPTEFTVTLPKTGSGYRVNTEAGYTTTINKNNDFKFNVTFVEGFKAGNNFKVKANGTELVDKDGVYTIKNVTEDYVITVEDVDIITPEDKVSVEFTFTKGQTDIYQTEETGTTMLMQKLDVPYFDLADYGLERYYYNPNCYLDKDGNPVSQTAGTRESAYGHVTAMHALICATEVFYLGYDVEDAGTGKAYRDDPEAFKEAVSWTQDAGSSFVDLWDFGTNLNYYLNYTYPLGRATWGSTSDQILIKDGDIFTAHLITGSASGSNFPFFIVNDTNGKYDISDQATHYGTTVEKYDQTDRATVKQGEDVEVTLYLANPAEGYTTSYTVQANKELYMVESYNLIPDLNAEDGWMLTDYVTDKDGKVVISTSDLKPGTYYFAAKGGVTPGGQDLGDGYITKGGETGVAVFELTVEEGETPPAPETYTVRIPVADEYTVYGATEVEGGTDYTFTVKVNEGYEKGENFAVKVNGAVIDAVDTDTYTVENVATDIEITVEGVEEIAQTPPTPSGIYGDLDNDGELTYKEVLTVLSAFRSKTELTQEQFAAADINQDGELEYKEVLTILKNFRTGEQGE